MNYDDNNPEHKKQLDAWLTRPRPNLNRVVYDPKQKTPNNSAEYFLNKADTNKRLEKEPGYDYSKDPNLIRRVKYLTETFDNADLGTSLDKAIENEDKQLAKLGRNPKNILQRNYPKKASPDQVKYLKNNLDKMKQQNKPAYRKGEAKIVVDELEREKRLKNPILNFKPIELSFKPIPSSPAEDPRLKELETRVIESKRKSDEEKIRQANSGLGGLLNGVKLND